MIPKTSITTTSQCHTGLLHELLIDFASSNLDRRRKESRKYNRKRRAVGKHAKSQSTTPPRAPPSEDSAGDAIGALFSDLRTLRDRYYDWIGDLGGVNTWSGAVRTREMSPWLAEDQHDKGEDLIIALQTLLKDVAPTDPADVRLVYDHGCRMLLEIGKGMAHLEGSLM